MTTDTPTASLRPHPTDTTPPSTDGTLFRLLVEHGADATFLLDLETEECVYVSPAVRALLGREPNGLIGRPLTEFLHPDDAAEVLARSLQRRRGQGVRTSVTRLRHAGGQWIWVEATASPVISYMGRTASVFTVSAAAKRARAELGLQASRSRFRRLLARLDFREDYPDTRAGSYELTVETLAAALELRDDATCRHARRVTELALDLTRVLDPELAADPELRYAYLLHDIGKIGIPDAILLKPDRLTGRELRTLQMHTTLGEHLLSFIPFLSDLVHDVVAYHHEHWDGHGYPWGLRGEAIPLAARIFAVADAFDAITNNRPYREARPVSVAITEIEHGAGTQFDPAVVEAFLPIARQRQPRRHRPYRSRCLPPLPGDSHRRLTSHKRLDDNQPGDGP